MSAFARAAHAAQGFVRLQFDTITSLATLWRLRRDRDLVEETWS